jgi:hypothetical protein
MTVDELIKELQMLQPELRAKNIVITAPNGLQFEPKVKRQLISQYNVMGGIENVKNMVLTFE